MLPKAINDLSRATAELSQELMEAAGRVLASGWFVMGPEVSAFEREFAAYCGSAHCVSLANGTDALEIGLRTLGLGPGARVATVANAGMYSSCAIRAVGAEPVYVDVDPASMLMSAEALRAAAARGLQAVIVTHLYGRLADMDALGRVAAEAGVPIIEDCAQSHGAARGGRRAGAFGALACFSFYPTKNLGALGDGGALVTADAALAQRAARLRQYGWSRKYFAQDAGGRNSRLDELQAAFLRVKLRRLDAANERRRGIAARYCAAIRNPRVRLPHPVDESFVAHLFVLQCERRDELASFLRERAVPVDVHYPLPDYRQPAMGLAAPPALAATEALCASVLTLPCFPEMTDAEVDAVAACVNDWTG